MYKAIGILVIGLLALFGLYVLFQPGGVDTAEDALTEVSEGAENVADSIDDEIDN